MKSNKFIPIGDVTIRISNTERRNTSNPRHCFTLSILDDDKKQIYRKEVVLHCHFCDTNTNEELQMVIEKMSKSIGEFVPQTKGEKEKFNIFIEKLKEELYRYSEMTKPVITLF